MRALVSAAIRACDAATRAFEAMADAFDEASNAWKAAQAFVREENARRKSYNVELFAKGMPKEEERNYVWALRKARDGYYVRRPEWNNGRRLWLHSDMYANARLCGASVSLEDELATDWLECGKVEP